MARKPINIPPIALTTSVANLLNCNITSLAGPVGLTLSQPFLIITRITIVNKTSSNHSFSLYKGATGASAAGTEIVGVSKVVAANDNYTFYPNMRLDAADFLTGAADANTSLVMQVDAEIGISG